MRACLEGIEKADLGMRVGLGCRTDRDVLGLNDRVGYIEGNEMSRESWWRIVAGGIDYSNAT
jgi:hypothetical protein